jgi:hypothetical protein
MSVVAIDDFTGPLLDTAATVDAIRGRASI